MADRLDNYDMLPHGMREYFANNGHHFSKLMYEWAVSMMRDRNGAKVVAMTKAEVDEKLKAASVKVETDYGYDISYVYMMGKADFWGSSIPDDAHLAKFVKDLQDDYDGYDSRAFDEFYAKTVALGIPIPWADVI